MQWVLEKIAQQKDIIVKALKQIQINIDGGIDGRDEKSNEQPIDPKKPIFLQKTSKF